MCGGSSRGLECPSDVQPRPQDQYGRDFIKYILKLVNIPECRHFSLMRPGIVPVSKTAAKSHDLEFPIFSFKPAFSHKE